MNTKLSVNRKFTRMFVNILSIVVILAMAFPAMGSASAQESTAFSGRDEFNGSLAEGWDWINENPEKWNLMENPGFLRIYASPYEVDGPPANKLMRNVTQHDFTIETRVLFEPQTNFQFAGLTIFQDDGNALSLGRAFCDTPDVCVGNGIYFDYVHGDEWGNNFGTTVGNNNEAYLRLERRDDMVKAFYSYEGFTWYEIGTHWIPSDFQVNGVGLVAVGDYDKSDPDIYADFDYFELTDGWGFLPEGFHDGEQGDVPSWACNANGWSTDPDDRAADVNIEIVVDDQTVATLPAGDFRQDLADANVCVDGNCSFSTGLWNVISSYEPHNVDAWAQDTTSGDWVLLSNSDKTLTCRTYDIYTFDPTLGITKEVANLRDTHEFNPRWSPDAKMIVHDTWSTDWSSHGVYITNVQTGASTPLAGAEGGSYPTWSPNGRWIAFDSGDRLFIVPPAGGNPKLVREDAFMASWAPNSQRLAFHQPSDGSIRTVNLNGANVVMVVERGNGPAWSPDGEWISYEVDGDVWKIHVNNNGDPLGNPIQLTSSPAWEGRPTWSYNSKTIAFHAGMGQDTDIWTIPAAGGEATWLTGAPNFGDYDANYSLKGQSQSIAYSSFSPDGQGARLWVSAYTYDPPVGTFDGGTHPYHFDFEWTAPEQGSWSGQGGEFVISDEAEIRDGYVLLRGPEEIHGINYPDGFACEPSGDINPTQSTRFLIGWINEGGDIPHAEAKAHFDSITATAVWDEGSVELVRHEIIPFREDDWFNYVCTFTEAPPKMNLRVNYGHDWVESFYEAGHAVSLQVTDSEGNVKATAEMVTEPKDYWGGATGFQTGDSVWFNADGNQLESPPDIQPYDWVYTQVDNGATAKVRIGEINGTIDLGNDSIQGTINASWIMEPVQVECLDWGSGGQPFDNKDGGSILTNGTDPYSCSWLGEWDIQYYQNVGVGYFNPDGHWVANAFFVRNPHFTVFPEWEWFDGLDWPDGATVSITVEGEQACTTSRESWGYFFNGGFPEGCDVEIGDTVTFTDGETVRTHTVRNLGITGVNAEEDTVAGTADANAAIYVWPHATGQQLEATADGEGNWQVDFTDVFDLIPGECGRSEIRDEVGNATAVDWCVPQPPRIVVQITDDWFRAENFTPNGELTFWVYEAEGGQLLRHPENTWQLDGSGYVTVGMWKLDEFIDLVPGNYLVVSDGTFTGELVLEAFTFDTFDLTNGQLVGTAPEPFGRLVWVGIGWENDGWSMEVTTGEDGSWIADFGVPVPSDFWWVAAQIFDLDGDASEVRPASQIIFLRPRCGTTYTVQAGSLLEIRYGSWLAIGEDLAEQNAQHLTVNLVLDGEPVTGVQQPVVPGSEIPCGASADAYGVFYVTQVAPLSAGTHVASVTWILDEAVTDGYDADGDGEPDWYGPGEVFTSEFTIIVQ